MSSPAPVLQSDTVNFAATVVLIVNGIFGLVCNTFIVYIFTKTPSERTSFNLICTFRAIANNVILLWTFFGTFIPITFLGYTPFSPEYETIVIGTCNAIYKSLQYTGLLIALNRCCAMFFPLVYSKIFRFKVTLAVTILIFAYKIGEVTYEFINFVIRVKCFLIYSPLELAWSPVFADECELFADGEIDFTAAFLGVLVVVNVATFTKIYFFYKSTDMVEEEVVKRVKKNRSLFLQTMFQDVIILLDMLFTFRMSFLFTNRIWTFFCGTFIWECVHSLDGLIMLMFNERLIILKKTLFASSPSSLITQTKVFPSEKVSPRVGSFPSPVH